MAKKTTTTSTDRAMARLGLSKADSNSGLIKDRLIVSVEGMDKQGKTHFALTAPAPLVFFNFDIGLEGVLHKHLGNGRDIYVQDVRLPAVKDTGDYNYLSALETFKRAYVDTMAMPEVQSIVIDTATELWELMRMARFGKLTQVMPHHYGPVNAEYREILRMAYDSDKNLILVHKVKAEYVNDKNTGNMVRSGFKDTGFMVQVNALSYRDEDDAFHLEVLNCRHNPQARGMDLEGDMVNFDMLKELVTS